MRMIKAGKGKPFVIVEMESWERKYEVMKTKSKLKGTSIYIDNDYTQEEMRVQRIIKEIAEAEGKKGNRTRIGYRKLWVNDRISI